MISPKIPYVTAAHNLLRETVLSAVDELIRHNGWAATSIATVAQAAGVSRQTVYNEFGSRRSLGDAYILHRLDELTAGITKAMESAETEVGLRAALELFFDMADEPLIQTILSGWSNQEDLIALIRMANERATARLAELFRARRPGLSEEQAVVVSDAVARIASSHAVAPTLPREVAIDRIVQLVAMILTDAPISIG
ncbi:TetR/AcrR family transcriptional regulator [Antrihabitans stalactiti]|uniref:TetR/AcrR family transcriptional regulator n=1 Tax=Antrihabitans stalactiti TaxID=2584121 RepID=A0A848KBR5_9NOCA|nr:TetR family transcriptional regulator [Antrihabitans stalactiti]NMN95136.1 TetR/AcrR family transcriptional regulator [Antrihabitans stalactiti]